jgi:hypothetical protein
VALELKKDGKEKNEGNECHQFVEVERTEFHI